tara:strand:- start:526 stop:1062 length:537 start_codon:yes stop_codon:yes gene_type:complete
MPLVTNSAGRQLYVLRQISNGDILKRDSLYPAIIDGGAIDGLDNDMEWLPIDRDALPAYDGRVFDLVTSEGKVGQQWRITYTTQKKTAARIKDAITQREVYELRKQVTDQERDKAVLLALGTFFSTLSNATYTAKQNALRTRILNAAQKLLANDTRATALAADADAGNALDIDSGWAP